MSKQSTLDKFLGTTPGVDHQRVRKIRENKEAHRKTRQVKLTNNGYMRRLEDYKSFPVGFKYPPPLIPKKRPDKQTYNDDDEIVIFRYSGKRTRERVKEAYKKQGKTPPADIKIRLHGKDTETESIPRSKEKITEALKKWGKLQDYSVEPNVDWDEIKIRGRKAAPAQKVGPNAVQPAAQPAPQPAPQPASNNDDTFDTFDNESDSDHAIAPNNDDDDVFDNFDDTPAPSKHSKHHKKNLKRRNKPKSVAPPHPLSDDEDEIKEVKGGMRRYKRKVKLQPPPPKPAPQKPANPGNGITPSEPAKPREPVKPPDAGGAQTMNGTEPLRPPKKNFRWGPKPQTAFPALSDILPSPNGTRMITRAKAKRLAQQ